MKALLPTSEANQSLAEQYLPIQQRNTRGADDRITLDELVQAYSIDESLVAPLPKVIGIVDDMLTAGTHYRAMQVILSERFPNATIVGLFVARRIFPED